MNHGDCVVIVLWGLMWQFERDIKYPDPEHIGRKMADNARVHSVCYVLCGGVVWWRSVVVLCGGVVWWCCVVVLCGGVVWWCSVV